MVWNIAGQFYFILLCHKVKTKPVIKVVYLPRSFCLNEIKEVGTGVGVCNSLIFSFRAQAFSHFSFISPAHNSRKMYYSVGGGKILTSIDTYSNLFSICMEKLRLTPHKLCQRNQCLLTKQKCQTSAIMPMPSFMRPNLK